MRIHPSTSPFLIAHALTNLLCAAGTSAISASKAPPPPPIVRPSIAHRPLTSCPTSWWTKPFFAAVKKLVRPATANRRRKQLIIKMQMPREVFEEIMSPLTTDDCSALKRDAAGHLEPTRTTAALNYFTYEIRKGSVSDRLFALHALDPPSKPPPKRKAADMLAIGEEEDIYEVEEVCEKRQKGKRTEYLIKWRDYPEDTNTWEPPSNINKALVDAFNGKEPKPPPKERAPSLPARGAGCARARLSSAEEARGGKPETISMVCGNVIAELKEPKDGEAMPTATLTFFVLSMDKTGHIIWPTLFDAKTQAALRMQARALLQKMMDDPANPVDSTMAPALTGRGTCALWVGAPQRKLVEVAMQVA